MLSIIRSAALVGVEAVPVEIEVNTGEKGELGLWLVGLPDAAVKESEERVQSALQEQRAAAPGDTHDDQPRPGRPEEGRRDLRPADRPRHRGFDRNSWTARSSSTTSSPANSA